MDRLIIKEADNYPILLKWYGTRQNNPGGTFYHNDVVSDYIFVQAQNVSDAKQKFSNITQNYSDYCSCCGDRWDYEYLDESDGKEEPMIYDKTLEECCDDRWLANKGVILYYYNGMVERILLKKSKKKLTSQ